MHESGEDECAAGTPTASRFIAKTPTAEGRCRTLSIVRGGPEVPDQRSFRYHPRNSRQTLQWSSRAHGDAGKDRTTFFSAFVANVRAANFRHYRDNGLADRQAGMDKFTCMQALVRVVESGSFAEAARRMSVSAPMVTKYISHLEQSLGSRLLNRSTHSLSLTDSGHAYYQRCVQLLEDLEEAEAIAGAPAAMAMNTGSSRATADSLIDPHSPALAGVSSPRLAKRSLPARSASMSPDVRRIFPCCAATSACAICACRLA